MEKKSNLGHDHNELYTHKDVCAERHKGVDTKIKTVESDVKQNAEDIKSINRKITASLVFVIVTFAAVLIDLLKGGI